MPDNLITLPDELIETTIFLIRGKRVILDRDLARLYGVTTKALNQAVKRNIERFPEDFIFQLTKTETEPLAANQTFKVTNCDLKETPWNTYQIPAVCVHRTRNPHALQRVEI
jgi:hypothetical protein